jgi:DnaK suppressor protein
VDKKSIARFKKLLQIRQIELRRRLSQVQREGHAIEPGGAKDEGDRATTSQMRELLFLQTSHDRSLLADLEEALARVDAGTFGECLNCGQEIGIKRLEAIPQARYCVTCQDLMDCTE